MYFVEKHDHSETSAETIEPLVTDVQVSDCPAGAYVVYFADPSDSERIRVGTITKYQHDGSARWKADAAPVAV